MNKYIVRTSLVWLGVLAVVVGIFYSRSQFSQQARSLHAAVNADAQPVASGPAPSAENSSAPLPTAPGTTSDAALVPLQLTPERMQSIGVKTGTVEYKQLSDDLRATGTVDIDEQVLSYVQVRFSGYIRKVFVNATYLYVRKGDPLFTIYSPDLVSTEQEYLLARQNQQALRASTIEGVASGAASLSAAAEQRLAQWEVSPSEVQTLQKTGKPITDLTIHSPVSGTVTEYNALPNMYVEPSTRLYTVADLSRVWVYAQVFQDDVGRLKPGDSVAITVDAYPGRTFHGNIDQILPQVDPATRTVRVRLVVQNPGLKLKPGMYVNCNLKSPLGRQLVVPASAVFQTGTKNLVFLYQGGGEIYPKEVLLGSHVGDDFVVLKGLQPHQRIVTSANFLIDSESQLQAAAGSFVPPPPGAGNVAAPVNAPAATQARLDFSTDPTPPQRGANTFRVKLTGPGNTPVTGASVTATFYMPAMPAMGMGAMSVPISLSDRGNGLYEGKGSLDSGGTWQVTISAQKNGQTLVTKQLRVDVTGGM